MQDYEKLGAFYIGRPWDLTADRPGEGHVLYDSRDLVTHALCVGMTGSGKTGLCIGLLEEAAIDGIPALVIDPKGDLTNLLLTFPQLRPQDFRPWINEEDGRRKGLDPDAYAREQAALWKKGLASWGQSGKRIKSLRQAADFSIYTPGSSAGLGLSILSSFEAPPRAILDDGELLAERTSSTATGLLGLLGITADPVRSREHILLATLLQETWKKGAALDLPGLIQQIQSPPVSRIGVLNLESFYPSKDRFELALAINNLLAAPGFDTWMEGEPFEIDAMLHTADGRPRISVFCIAHLSDAQRMFFVSLLLNQTLSWMRSQSGTTSLRALVYMDEIAGYFPPVSNPPSKGPLLTLLKQARAFGLGVVLATQNPVDLDYKGLANIGTWFIGRLQTDRDKQRLLDGLEGAAVGSGQAFDRQAMAETLAGLRKRVFLLNNVHDDAPEIFETRWVMSYLRGPLGREQIRRLVDPRRKAREREAPAAGKAATGAPAVAPDKARDTGGDNRPVVAPGIPQVFLPVRGEQPEGSELFYRPVAVGAATLHFLDSRKRIDETEPLIVSAALSEGPATLSWDGAQELDLDLPELRSKPRKGARYAELPANASRLRTTTRWERGFKAWLYRTRKLELFKSKQLKQLSRTEESERDFRLRLKQLAREQRDLMAERLRQKYLPKKARLEDRLRRAEQAVDREAGQAKSAKLQTVISFGATLLSAFTGRKKTGRSTIGKATTAARGVSRSMQQSRDVERAAETVEAVKLKMQELEDGFRADTAALEEMLDPMLEELSEITVRVKKQNITVRLVGLAWAPHWRDPEGVLDIAWQ